jgi:hypothetical protein
MDRIRLVKDEGSTRANIFYLSYWRSAPSAGSSELRNQ